jgi:hypothetical protein
MSEMHFYNLEFAFVLFCVRFLFVRSFQHWDGILFCSSILF